MKYLYLILFAVVLSAFPAFAEGEKILVNTDGSGLALQGYDPVAFFTAHRPVQGKEDTTYKYQGATYRFSTPENKALFAKDPAHYAPQFGGFCAYAVSRGHTASIDVNAFQIVDGKLLLQYDRGIRDDFNSDQAANVKKAQQNWPKIVAEKGK